MTLLGGRLPHRSRIATLAFAAAFGTTWLADVYHAAAEPSAKEPPANPAAPSEDPSEHHPAESPGFGGLWVGAIAVLGLAYAATKVRRGSPPAWLTGNKGSLELVCRLPLGPHMAVAAVRTGDEVLLLGVTPQGISLLRTVAASSFVAQPPAGLRNSMAALRQSAEATNPKHTPWAMAVGKLRAHRR